MEEEFNWPLFIDNLWERENAKGKRAIEGKGGYHKGLYFPYTTPNGDIDIGPGLDMSKQTPEFRARARRGFTREELDSIVKSRLQNERQYFNQRIAKEGGDSTKLTNKVYAGLLDMQWQLGNGLYQNYPEFWKAVANQDYEGMQRESKTYYGPEGDKKLDGGRWNFRKQAYFQPPVTPQNTWLINRLEELKATNPLNHSDGGQLQKHRTWNDLSLEEKSDMIRVAVKNGITSLDEIRQRYNEFAGGGDTDGSWTMEDEAGYRAWRETLPANLRNTNDNMYDMRGAYRAGLQPTLEDDGLYHLGSRDPRTGMSLKSLVHPTHTLATVADAMIGYHPYMKNGREYTDTWEGNDRMLQRISLEKPPVTYAFGDGGSIHIAPSREGTFTAAATKHGKSVQEFASQVLAHPENYSPAMRKKANFARNSAKWHGLGGPLVEAAMAHQYDGTSEDSQQMNKIGGNKPVTTGGAGYIPDNYGWGLVNFLRKIGVMSEPEP